MNLMVKEKYNIDAENPVIKIVGFGNTSSRVVDILSMAGLEYVACAVCDTDEDEDEIRKLFCEGIKVMIAIAEVDHVMEAPSVLTKIAMEQGILTVGIVVIPFRSQNEGMFADALRNIQNFTSNVDSLMVIDNEKLKQRFGFSMQKASELVDDMIAKMVEEFVCMFDVKPSYASPDIYDAIMILRSGKMAIICSGEGEGENRIIEALTNANDSMQIYGISSCQCCAKMLRISFPESESDRIMEEMRGIMDQIEGEGDSILRFDLDNSLNNRAKVTILGVTNDCMLHDCFAKSIIS